MSSETKWAKGPLGPPNDHRKAKVIRLRALDQEALGFSIAFSMAINDAERAEYAANATLIASAQALYEELDALSFTLGAAYVQYLQGDMSGFEEFAKSARVEFKTDGSPRLVCPALASARGEG